MKLVCGLHLLRVLHFLAFSWQPQLEPVVSSMKRVKVMDTRRQIPHPGAGHPLVRTRGHTKREALSFMEKARDVWETGN